MPRESALQKLITTNDKLALKVAHRMRGHSPMPFEDLCQVARIGLIQAARRYDPDSGHRFSSFAVPWIRGEIMHALRTYNPDLLKVSQWDRTWRQKVRSRQRELAKYGRELSEEQVAIAYGLTPERWAEIVKHTSRNNLLDIDALALAGAEDSHRVRDDIYRAINALPHDQQAAVRRRYFRGRKLNPDQQAALDQAHETLREMLGHA